MLVYAHIAVVNLSAVACRRGPVDKASAERKCHCLKSQCLKLYCDCYAAGQYCNGCSCNDCHNNESNAALIEQKKQEVRQRGPEVCAS